MTSTAHSVSKEALIPCLWLWRVPFLSAGNGCDIAEELLHSCAPPVLWSSCNWHALTCFVSPTPLLMYFQLTKILAAGCQEHNLITLGYWKSCCVITLISLNNPVLILVPKIVSKNVNKLWSIGHHRSDLSLNGLLQSAPTASILPSLNQVFLSIPDSVTVSLSSSFCCFNMTLLNRHFVSFWTSPFPLLDEEHNPLPWEQFSPTLCFSPWTFLSIMLPWLCEVICHLPEYWMQQQKLFFVFSSNYSNSNLSS